MNISGLEAAVEYYANKLSEIEASSSSHPTKQQILDILIARDKVHILLNNPTQTCKDILMKVIILDERLKKQNQLITKLIPLSEWRSSLCPSTGAWWWFLEPATHRWDRYDWVWRTLTIIFVTASLSLLLDIFSRFLFGIPDTLGFLTIATQSILALLAIEGALTKQGQEGIEYILKKLNIPKHFQTELKFGIAVGLFLCLITFRYSLPNVASYYKMQGKKEYIAGRLSNAQSSYIRATKLNAEDWEAHFILGNIYQTLQDIDRARAEYLIAIQGDFQLAYNHLARLYILDKKYPAAIALLKEAEKRTKNSEDKELNYLILKNYGWARLEQKRYKEAKAYLKQAIDLRNDLAPAHCLMAIVLERLKSKKEALIEWENCIAYINNESPDEDNWLGLANQCLTRKDCLNIKGED